jgi:DnaK suppressor protein
MTKSLLSPEHEQMFRRLLNTERHRLIEGTSRTVEDMGEDHPSFADPGDRAAWESDSTRDLRIRDRERKLVDKIDQAIARLDDGSFGECEECGEMISIGRLRARPVTTLCIQCKAEQEAGEAGPGKAAG